VHSEDIHELVLDGGFVQPKQDSHDAFVAPDINAFGHTFRLVAIQFPFHCFYQFFLAIDPIFLHGSLESFWQKL
jgi:hypothetical protein